MVLNNSHRFVKKPQVSHLLHPMPIFNNKCNILSTWSKHRKLKTWINLTNLNILIDFSICKSKTQFIMTNTKPISIFTKFLKLKSIFLKISISHLSQAHHIIMSIIKSIKKILWNPLKTWIWSHLLKSRKRQVRFHIIRARFKRQVHHKRKNQKTNKLWCKNTTIKEI